MNRSRILFLLLLLIPVFVHAQMDVRARIDMERRYLRFDDDKTLEKTRGFIRDDSTFYIGHMYMGAYFFYRAADKPGFNRAIPFLDKAMQLIEKDYDKQLRTRTNDIYTYLQVNPYQADYSNIAYWLQQAYQNTDRPDKAFEVLCHVRDRNLQFEQSMETYNTMAWIYHRNRTYTSKNFPFLKNSVHANDSMAYMYLDSAIYKIQNDAEINVGIYDATYINRLYYFTYHYKAILFDHDLQIDSANFYYDILLNSGYYSSNNYAEFQHAMGEFRTAEDYFIEAESREGGSLEKRTKEYFYMRGQIEIYKAKPAAADSLLKHVIDQQGFTPGFGWHAIGLARALHYEGLNAESQKWANKAANFEEVHISTTWGQEQYNLAVATLNYTNQKRFYEEYLFENDQWYFWMNPVNWWASSNYKLAEQKYKLTLATMVARNPERMEVIYPLLTSENLINFDEVSNVIEGFGTDYFIKIYKKLLEEDKRPKLKKYFAWMLGRLYLQKGDKNKAIDYFEQVLSDPDIHDDYSKLLYARTCEGMAMASSKSSDIEYWTREMFNTYPELVPFTDLKMKFQMDSEWKHVGKSSGTVWVLLAIGLFLTIVLYGLRKYRIVKLHWTLNVLPALVLIGIGIAYFLIREKSFENNPAAKIVSQLRDCAIDFDANGGAPTLYLEFEKTKDAMEITYTVQDEAGKSIEEGLLRVSEDQMENAGKLLAYRLYGINKKIIGEQPEPEPEKTKDGKDSVK